jgi:uncharacterized lipoprotein YmbA
MERVFLRAIVLILGFLGIVLSGCASTPSTRFFVLSSVYDPGKMRSLEGERCYALAIGPVRVSEYLNQPEIVTRINQNEVRLDEFAKWAEPLENNVSRVLADNLRSLLCIRSIAVAPWRGRPLIDYRIDVNVIQMDGQLGENASLEISWSIGDGADRKKPPLFTKISTYEEPIKGGDYASFVAAQSRNVASLSRDVAGAIVLLSK